MPSSRRRGAPDPRAQAVDAVRLLVSALFRSARSVETRTGRTNAQIAVLRAVAHNDGASVNEIAERVRVGQNTVSTVLSRLEGARLVRKESSTADARQVCIRITTAGRALLRRAPKPPTEQLLAAVQRLSPSEAARVARALGPLVKRLRHGPQRPPMLFE